MNMGDEVLVPANCPLCESKNREQIEEDLARGVLTRRAVSAELNMSMDEINDHMKEHFTTGGKGIVREKNPLLEAAPDKLRELYQKRDVLFTLFVQLKDRIDVYLSRDEFTASQTKQIVTMTDSLRKLAMDLAKLEGELRSEDKITIYMYNELKMVILSVLCEDCQGKVIEQIDKGEQKAIEEIDLSKLNSKL